MSSETRIPGGVTITRNDIDRHKRELLDSSMLVKVKEAATILACSPRTVHTLIQNKELTAYNNTGARSQGTRLLAAELRNYVNSMKIKSDDWRK